MTFRCPPLSSGGSSAVIQCENDGGGCPVLRRPLAQSRRSRRRGSGRTAGHRTRTCIAEATGLPPRWIERPHPVIYELVNILKKNSIDYSIWNSKINDYVANIFDNHQIKMKGIQVPVPWIPVCIILPSIGLWFLLRYLGVF